MFGSSTLQTGDRQERPLKARDPQPGSPALAFFTHVSVISNHLIGNLSKSIPFTFYGFAAILPTDAVGPIPMLRAIYTT